MILRLSDIKINFEFENVLPKLTAEQFTKLEENMVREGRARNPLVIWKDHDILTDGHNRLRVLKAHPELGWTFIEQEFDDEDDVKEWIIKNALGTRNLTEMQFTDLTGRLLIMRKGSRGSKKGELRAEKDSLGRFTAKSKKCTLRSGDVAEQVASELGVNRSTVYNAARVSVGLDAAEAVVPGTKERVLAGELKAQKAEIASWSKKTPKQIESSVAEVEARNGKKRTNTDRTLAKKIREIDASMSSVSTAKYGLNELLREIDALGDAFLLSLESMVNRRSDVIETYDGGMDKVHEHIDTIINKLNEIKKGI